MTKYQKGITFNYGKTRILVINKDSFEECDEELLKMLDQLTDIDQDEIKEIKRLILE